MLKSLIGFRKVIIMFVFLTIGIIFRVLDFIDGSQFVDLIKITGVAFFGSNLSKHVVDALTGGKNE